MNFSRRAARRARPVNELGSVQDPFSRDSVAVNSKVQQAQGNPGDSTFFELRCSSQRVADSAHASLCRLVDNRCLEYFDNRDGYPQVSGRLPAGVASIGVFQGMVESGGLLEGDWATLYTRDTGTEPPTEAAWALSSDTQDTRELSRIAFS